ncbi:MAG TPA: type II secretion system secretin GspD [Thermodesulfobacteriota bacterium]|nr:type II secretion system secretin GspD [Thermodesulfobacteriota bacterium]
MKLEFRVVLTVVFAFGLSGHLSDAFSHQEKVQLRRIIVAQEESPYPEITPEIDEEEFEEEEAEMPEGEIEEEVFSQERIETQRELQQRETGEGEEIVNLQAEMDIRDLVQTVSEITGEVFILDESVRARRITIITPRDGFKKQNTLSLFEAILDLNGFAIVSKDGVNKIIPKRDIKFESIPTSEGKEYAPLSDRYVTRIVSLKNLSAAEVATTLRPFVSREGDVVAYPASNTLIVVETQSNLNRVLKIIENLDTQTDIEFIKIQHSEAADIAVKLGEIFGGEVSGIQNIPQSAAQQRQIRRIPSSRIQSGSSTGQQIPLGFNVIVDERTNTLIVTANPDDMNKIKAIIEKLDVEVEEPEQGIYVIRLQNADAEHVVLVLSNLIGGGGGGVTSTARTGQRRTVEEMEGLGGRTTGGFGQLGSSFQEGQVGGITGGFGEGRGPIERGQTGEGQGVFVAEAEGLMITADPATNSVIIVSSRKDYEILKNIISDLDVRRRQVFVEAAILEVNLDQIRSLGTNFSFGFTFNDDNLGFGGTALPGIPSLLGIAAGGEGSVISAIGGLSGLFLGVIGDTVDPDGSGPIPPIPSFSALFQALATIADVNVLSTPSLLTTDNEEAEIVVADVIPFPTGSTVAETGVTVQTIDRQPVGIRLVITPQISEGDFLNLNIYTEVSAIRQAPPDLNTDVFGIATTTRSADSSIVVKNGQTIVIGGLVQDRESVIESKVPLLGDIPFLGYAFKYYRRRSEKINLMVILTPRIVENEADIQNILEERQRRNMLLQQKGFEKEIY